MRRRLGAKAYRRNADSDIENTYFVASEAEYDAWVALLDSGSVCQFLDGSATAFCQHGIVWRFDRQLDYGSSYGRFVSGDFWAAAPFYVVEKLPAWNGTRHGSMLDFQPDQAQGFYNIGSFNPANRAVFPLLMDDDDTHSLIMTNGLATPATSGAFEFLSDAVVFTSVTPARAASLTATTFRPAYLGDKRFLDWADADTSILPDFALPSGATLPATGQMAKPWLHNYSFTSSDGAFIHPRNNMPPYPRDSGLVVSDYAAAVLVGSANRDTYAKELTQVGIDLFGVHKSVGGYTFYSAGGFGNGWKFPILFASLILNDATMQAYDNTIVTEPTLYSFGEDAHTYIGDDELNPGTDRPLWGRSNLGWSLPYYPNHDIRDPAGILEVEATPTYSWFLPSFVSGAAGASTGAFSGDGAGGGTQSEISLLGSPNLATSTTSQILCVFISGVEVFYVISAINNTTKKITVSSAFGADLQPVSLPDIRSGALAVAWSVVNLGGYRLCCTSHTWPGQWLGVLNITGMQTLWDYAPWGQYVDRWVTEGYDGAGAIHLYGSDFVEAMWTDYR